MAEMDSLPEEDKLKMSTVIDQLQIRDRYSCIPFPVVFVSIQLVIVQTYVNCIRGLNDVTENCVAFTIINHDYKGDNEKNSDINELKTESCGK